MEVTTCKIIDKIHYMVLSDRRIKVREIVEATGISQGTVFSILHEKLDVKKISARFWDARGIIYTDYLEKGQTITRAYYASLLHRLSEEIKKKLLHLKKILVYQDNA